MQAYNPAVSHKRKERDITKLMMSNYKVYTNNENPCNFKIEIKGPLDSLYTGGIWTLNVYLPDQYPYKSPSIGFINKIFHPNVDEASGSICLDVINQSWSPMYDLINVFDVFIPQLLQYPNPSDPLNPEAASLLMREKSKYEKKVREMVQKYAVKVIEVEKKTIENIEILKNQTSVSTQNSDSKEEMIDEENVSLISLSDVSELSQHSVENNDIMSQF